VIRSFLAFELPKGIKSRVVRMSEDLRRSAMNVRWINTDNIHLTMVFLGNIQEQDIPAIHLAVEKVCIRYAPFHVALTGLGAFPNAGRPRVVWLGLRGDTEKMSYFKKALQKHLRPFGVKEEKRAFRPHLTLGRFKSPGHVDSQLDNFINAYKDLSSPTCTLTDLVLFRSDLNPGGAIYTKLRSWPLSGPEQG
jgi:2'-5' RNA ligase